MLLFPNSDICRCVLEVSNSELTQNICQKVPIKTAGLIATYLRKSQLIAILFSKPPTPNIRIIHSSFCLGNNHALWFEYPVKVFMDFFCVIISCKLSPIHGLTWLMKSIVLDVFLLMQASWNIMHSQGKRYEKILFITKNTSFRKSEKFIDVLQ